MTTAVIDPIPAIQAYYDRIKEGTATPEEFRIFPEMLDRFETSAPIAPTVGEPHEQFDGMSDAGKRGEFPMEGLVNAFEVAAFIGKSGLKKPAEAVMKMARAGLLPMPYDMGSKPYQWLAQEVREHIAQFKKRKGAKVA